jgi:hypothetical protein
VLRRSPRHLRADSSRRPQSRPSTPIIIPSRPRRQNNRTGLSSDSAPPRRHNRQSPSTTPSGQRVHGRSPSAAAPVAASAEAPCSWGSDSWSSGGAMAGLHGPTLGPKRREAQACGDDRMPGGVGGAVGQQQRPRVHVRLDKGRGVGVRDDVPRLRRRVLPRNDPGLRCASRTTCVACRTHRPVCVDRSQRGWRCCQSFILNFWCITDVAIAQFRSTGIHVGVSGSAHVVPHQL